MGKISHLKAGKRYEGMKFFQNNFASRTKLNLNDLLKRRKEEKKSDKKTNLNSFGLPIHFHIRKAKTLLKPIKIKSIILSTQHQKNSYLNCS